ncbi:MAG: cytochrome C biogenesis protein [Cytophagales bacterium]|nr:MAG: cytochrome C biogenesis protein [Cytophagales bacterium]TAF60384.1 MAG: cytochrome C biogenesis protein [Cytophagales bacterium]
MDTLAGFLGHLFIIVAFVSAALSAVAYYKAESSEGVNALSWQKIARLAFGTHAFSVLGTIFTLFGLIYLHSYQYHYVWSHSSNNLPVYYMISCFWEGQEGSFLLWIFWHVVLAFFVARRAGVWEHSAMCVFAAVQAFLCSMILGVVIPYLDLKIGSSPFLLLKEAMPNAPIFSMNPSFVPTDGNGLNPLLQNYWMVIHPPTLFLGFALTLVPFAFLIAGMQKNKPVEWIKPALPWALLGVAVLGIGIMMGAYWAYETLNFEGYWNWDPVENAVYVPWLVLVGAVHLMFSHTRRSSASKWAAALTALSFILILYSTFLTRSGILGNASVHSFTDLGLSGQLLIYLLFFLGVAIYYLASAWRSFPKSEREVSPYHGEFWVFLGALALCLAAFQVLVPTSIPVYNALLKSMGVESNLAPPADQVEFYTKFQLWFGIAIAFLSATAQFFWWNRLQMKTILDAFAVPLILTMLVSAGIIYGQSIKDWQHIVLLTVSVYALLSNVSVLWRMARSSVSINGGAVAHIGVALMLIGILISSAFSEVISLNTTGLLYSKEFSEETNRNNLLLFRNTPQKMQAYTITYKGPRVDSRDAGEYINRDDVQILPKNARMIAKKDLYDSDSTLIGKRGDTLQVYGENTYYEVDLVDQEGKKFTLFPRVQLNPDMGTAASPDIRHFWNGDLYAHLSNIPDPDKEVKWSPADTFEVSLRDTFVVNDFIAVLEEVSKGAPEGDEDYLIYAKVRIMDNGVDYEVKPKFKLKGSMVSRPPEIIEAAGIKMVFENINPNTNRFKFSVQSTQKDWVIIKALSKPFVNVLWIGTLLMGIGTLMAVWQRFRDWKNSQTEEV